MKLADHVALVRLDGGDRYTLWRGVGSATERLYPEDRAEPRGACSRRSRNERYRTAVSYADEQGAREEALRLLLPCYLAAVARDGLTVGDAVPPLLILSARPGQNGWSVYGAAPQSSGVIGLAPALATCDGCGCHAAWLTTPSPVDGRRRCTSCVRAHLSMPQAARSWARVLLWLLAAAAAGVGAAEAVRALLRGGS